MKKMVTSFFIILMSVYNVMAQEESRLMRFPAIFGNQVVFTYAGDLYSVQYNGGVARKLTNHSGFEMFPRFSPDGKLIAFTAQYDGNTEIYLIPAEGGIPRRLTYTSTLNRDDIADRMGPNNIIMGWKHDGKQIVFRSRMKSFNDFKGKLYLAEIDGGLPVELPLPAGGFCSFSPDDKKLAYNRVFREFRTWKRYRGGMADDIWIYDFNSKKIENITNNPALDIIPMWYRDKIFFISDRDENKRMNLYEYDINNKKTKKLTEFKEYDIKFPSLGDKAIVFENGGFIYSYDLQSEKYQKINIKILEDFAGSREQIVDVSKNISNFEISPDGKRALFGARGDVFTVPAQRGITRNLTNSPGIHDRNSKWSPNGKWIAYVSDESGEDEIYLNDDKGINKPVQITKESDAYKYDIEWSPDSKKILWSDSKMRLRYVDIDSKSITEVVQSKNNELRDAKWSPDSKWITYSNTIEELLNKIYIYSLDKKTSSEVTDGWYPSTQPVFSSDGKYLVFTSNRDFNPTYSWTEWNHIYQNMAKIYMVTLSNETDSPFKPKNDEVSIKEEKPPIDKKTEEKKNDDKKEKKEDLTIKIDLDGIKERIMVIPIQAAGYGNITSVGDKLYYQRFGNRDPRPVFLMYDLIKLTETELGTIGGYEISADKKKMLISQDGSYGIIDIPQGKIELKERLNLSGMEIKLNKHDEWTQIYNECWRQMRDFFYAPNMHGVDWKAIKKKYLELTPFVNHRADLTYIIGEMIGELCAGHTYVGGGESPQVRKITMGLLGAEIIKDEKSGYFKIQKILKGRNWDNGHKSPLTEIGVNIKEGDYIIAINDKSTKDVKNIFELLINTSGKQVKIKYNSEIDEKNAKETIVIPIADESKLYYYNWVQENLKKVNEATKGKVGYIHVPDMAVEGLNEFVKYYYPQLKKKALIVDVRGNAGGNVSPMLIERLSREIVFADISRNTNPNPNPGGMLFGPKICLLDEYSASDGDLFPYRFRMNKLGKLVGKRSWGGVVGIRGTLPLLDGSFLNKPEFSRYDPFGKGWVIEGVGVEPDIYVDNDPANEYSGNDEQLNRAIEEILIELKNNEKVLPPVPPYPDKSK